MQGIELLYTRYQSSQTFAIIAASISVLLMLVLIGNGFVMYAMDDPESVEKEKAARRADTILLVCLAVCLPISFAIFYYHECLYKEIVTACSKSDHELCKSVSVRNKVGRKVC